MPCISAGHICVYVYIEQPEAGYRRARSGDLESADEQELVLLQVPVLFFPLPSLGRFKFGEHIRVHLF